jgi:hypothetical protein
VGIVFELILFILVTTYMSISLLLGHADSLNTTYTEMAVTEAILKAPPAGYITPVIQQDIRTYLKDTRGMDPTQVVIEGTTSVSERKVKGSGDETISLRVRYPRKTYIFFGGMRNGEYKPSRSIQTEYTDS